MKNSKKVIHRFSPEELAQVIADYFEQLQSPDGYNFKSIVYDEKTIVIKIANQSFIVSVTDKNKLS
jgi:hypothetical protein